MAFTTRTSCTDETLNVRVTRSQEPMMLLPEIHLIEDGDIAPSRPARKSGRRPIRALAIAAAMMVALAATGGGSAAWAAAKFSDVPDNHPFASDINWMTTHDIAEGYPDGTFKPASPVSRQAAAAYLHNYNQQFEMVRIERQTTADSYFLIEVPCPQGKTPVAGGGYHPSMSMNLHSSYPSYSAQSEWNVSWKGTATAGSTAYAWALCIPMS